MDLLAARLRLSLCVIHPLFIKTSNTDAASLKL